MSNLTNNDLKHMLDTISDGVFCIDHDGNISYWNLGAERITGYEPRDVVGLQRCSDVLKHVDSEGNRLCNTSDCPHEKALHDPSFAEEEVFIEHRFGHRVPVLARMVPLSNEHGEATGFAQIFTEVTGESDIRRRLAEYQKLALLDPLTEVGNRRLGQLQLQRLFNERQRYGTPFGLTFIDIDHFRDFNNQYGHDVGDNVLVTIARTLVANTRSLDDVARWGGEEFVGLIKNVDRENLQAIANKLRAMVEHSRVHVREKNTKVTVSIGATLARPSDTPRSLVRRADELMYESKHQGRNKVTLG